MLKVIQNLSAGAEFDFRSISLPVHILCIIIGYLPESFHFRGNFLNSRGNACNAGDPGSSPALRRSPGEGIGYPFQYSWASLVAQLEKNPPAM